MGRPWVYIIVEFLKTEDNFYGKWSDFERGMIKYNMATRINIKMVLLGKIDSFNLKSDDIC